MARLHLTLLIVLTLCSSNLVHTVEEDTISKPALQINDEDHLSKPQGEFNKVQRAKRQYYYPSWSSNAVIRVPPVQSYTLWQPPYYQIRRPYFISVWESAGRIPVYLPPQTIYINPGYPPVNPPKPFPGRPYVPPDTNTEPPGTNDNTTQETGNRFIESGGPVWDQIPNSQSASARPTRRPKVPGQQTVTSPPLVHKEAPVVPDTLEKSAGTPIGSFRPSGGDSAKPQPPKETPVLPPQPSRCVWAIISCCSANSHQVTYSCFEQLGCMGAFWDKSPCESEFARSAISAAMNYYNAK